MEEAFWDQDWVSAAITFGVALLVAFVVDRFVIGRATRVAARVGDRRAVSVSRAAQTRLRLIRRLVFVTIIVIGIILALSEFTRLNKLATGHDHRQHVDRYGAITVVDGGTLGAGGVFDAGVAFAGFAELHFETDSPVLRAVDLVAVEPFSGRGQGSRVVIDTLCPGEERCSFTPSEPEVDVPDASVEGPSFD